MPIMIIGNRLSEMGTQNEYDEYIHRNGGKGIFSHRVSSYSREGITIIAHIWITCIYCKWYFN